ncbi:MAG: LmbE family protein [Pirellula sp.]|nr:LmbE family protein [Pirellula sp.]
MPSVFAIAAHPDDIEIVMAGTLSLLKDAGYDVHYMNVANGCCGSTVYGREELIAMRRAEAEHACRLAGFTFHNSIADDMEVMYDRPTLRRLTSIVREVRPEIVLTHSPVDYMEDHTNTCRLATTAAFARCMPNYPCDPATPAYFEDVTVYHAQPHGNCNPLYGPILPKLFVDVGTKMDLKTEMLAAHKSQKLWLDQSQGMDSYLHSMQQLMREVGRLSGGLCEYAEGWRKHLHLGFCAADADPLTKALGSRVHGVA